MGFNIDSGIQKELHYHIDNFDSYLNRNQFLHHCNITTKQVQYFSNQRLNIWFSNPIYKKICAIDD